MNLGAFVDAMFGLLGLLIILFVAFVASVEKPVERSYFVDIRVIGESGTSCESKVIIAMTESSCDVEAGGCVIEPVTEIQDEDISIVPNDIFTKRGLVRYSEKMSGEKSLIVIAARGCSEEAPEMAVTILRSTGASERCILSENEPVCQPIEL